MAMPSNSPRPLPSVLSHSISTTDWTLTRPLSQSMPPLNYMNMQEMSSLRKRDACINPANEWMADVPRAIDTFFNNNGMSPVQYDYGILALSIILLGNQYTDEAHNLITPYSWPEEIHTSFGPVKYSTADAGVVSVATYIHSMVHRREGWNIGELGMVGWDNANYWGGAWSRPFRSSDALRELWKEPLYEIQQSMLELTSSGSVKKWCEENLPELFMNKNDFVDLWDPRGLHRLCAHVTKDDCVNNDLLEFSQETCRIEMNALLSLCVDKAGYALPTSENSDKAAPPSTYRPEGINIDDDIALSAANRISSAHAEAFRSEGVVVLRNVVKSDQCSSYNSETAVASVAAGISTRLLNAAACKMQRDEDNAVIPRDDTIGILIPMNREQAEKYSKIASMLNKGPLFIGDGLVVAGSSLQKICINKGDIDEFRVHMSCSKNDQSAVFVNKLHGGKGETPTTVVQWSKGTVHHST